jgi:hypothetical protein
MSTIMICTITAAKVAFHGLVDFAGALPDQEQAAGDQDQVAPGNFLLEHGEQRLDQPDDPRQHQQQAYAHEHGHEQAQAARQLLLVFGQLVDQDGDEDDVVYAQHQLQRGEGGEGNPGLRVGEQFHHVHLSWRQAISGVIPACSLFVWMPGKFKTLKTHRRVLNPPPGHKWL